MKKTIGIHKGFTLIELMVVIAIIGILATIIMVSFSAVQQRARDGQRKADLRQIQSALELYKADNGVYPTYLANCPVGAPTFMGNDTDVVSPCSTIYMQTIPVDPKTKLDYKYIATQSGTDPNSSTITDSNCTATDPCVRYAVIACIETAAGADEKTKKKCEKAALVDKTGISYTLQNP